MKYIGCADSQVTGLVQLVVCDVPEAARPTPKLLATEKVLCCLKCGKSIAIAKMRDHVGLHILHKNQKSSDPFGTRDAVSCYIYSVVKDD
jgi:hypothetical protein